MNRPEDLDLLRDALLMLEPGNALMPGCLDDDTVAALAEGSLDAASRPVALAHLAECPRCRAAVASVARALDDPEVAREIVATPGTRGRRVYRVALPLAAAAVLLVIAWPRQVVDRTPVHRAPTITAAAAPSPLSPMGTVADAGVLRWSAVAGADRYRVTLFDSGSRVVYETQLADTVAALPDSIVLVPGQRYLWKVEARTGRDRWSASALVDFSMARGVSP